MPDTLAADTLTIARFQQDGAYDYDRELTGPSQTLSDLVWQFIEELLSSVFGSEVGSALTRPVVYTIFVILLAVVCWFVYKSRPGLFSFGGRRRDNSYEVVEDNIYGIDFERELAAARQRHDYREAVRLVYLQTLRYLSDQRSIQWQPYKTPTQYVVEHPSAPFRQMTNHFLRVRYGNFEADATMLETMLHLQEQTKRESTTPQQETTPSAAEKGGKA